MTYLLVVARYVVKDGESETVQGLLREQAEASRQEPACQAFDVFADIDDPHRIVLLERYDDEAGFAAHRETEHFGRIIQSQVIPRLESREVETYVGA